MRPRLIALLVFLAMSGGVIFAWPVVAAGVPLISFFRSTTQSSIPGTATSSHPIHWDDTSQRMRFSDGTADRYVPACSPSAPGDVCQWSGSGWTNSPVIDSGLGVFNVKSYGAAGDGVSDDTVAINAAIAAANGTAEVVIPAGTYLVKNLSVSVDNTRIRGMAGATLKLKSLACGDGSPILNITANNVFVHGLKFDGNKAAHTADGFSDSFAGGGFVCAGSYQLGRSYRAAIVDYKAASTLSGLTVTDCTFTGTYGAGIATQNVSQIKIHRNVDTSSNFELGYIYNSQAVGTYDDDVEATDNYIASIGTGDAIVQSNGFLFYQVRNGVFANNVIQTVERNGLKVSLGKGIVVAHNVVRNVTFGNFCGLQAQGEGFDLVFEGNKVSDAPCGINIDWIAGGTGWRNVSVVNNSFDNTTSLTTADGVSITPGVAGGDFAVRGNTMTQIGRYGVFINGNASITGISVVGNQITTTGMTGGGGVVFSPSVSGTNAIVTDNLINLGNINVNASGIKFFNGGGSMANVILGGNEIITGAAHTAISEDASAITSGSIYPNYTDGTVSIPDLSTTFTNPTTFSGNVTLGTALQSNPSFAVGTHSFLVSQSGIDANGSTMTWTAGQGGTASATGGGSGGTSNFAGANGGNGTGALNPGAGGASVLEGGNAGTGGTGNASGGNAYCRGGVKQGTGTNGKCVLADANTSAIDVAAAGIPINMKGITTFTGTTFATLPTPSNGMMMYCSDCTIANPCASGGTGAFAKRLNGVWVCN